MAAGMPQRRTMANTAGMSLELLGWVGARPVWSTASLRSQQGDGSTAAFGTRDAAFGLWHGSMAVGR